MTIGNTFTLATLSYARIDCTFWSKGGRQEDLAVAESVESAVDGICGMGVRAQDELHAARTQPGAATKWTDPMM